MQLIQSLFKNTKLKIMGGGWGGDVNPKTLGRGGGGELYSGTGKCNHK